MFKEKPRTIIDTNLLISRLLTPSSVTASAVRMIMEHCHLLVSQATIDEFVIVLMRMKAKKYISSKDISLFLNAYKNFVEWVPIIDKVQICRDPKDDKFLDLALNGNAKYLVTSDSDLLVLNPFKTTKIITHGECIKLLTS